MRTIIDQALAQKAQDLLIELNSEGVVANRLKAIIASFNHPIKMVADIFDVDSTTITRWANKLKRNGIKGLVNAPKHLDGIIVKNKHKQQVQRWLKSDPNITIARVKIKLEEQFGIKISPATAHNIMKAVGFSHITARSVHYKQDKEKLEEFKKNSNQNQRSESK
jgi:transposase